MMIRQREGDNLERFHAGEADVLVIGGGHAGIEAALAASRLGKKTILFTISLDAIGNLPCNPSIGGTAKGHLVREVDALGGEMGKLADAATIQSRMLNRGKGPAVHSLRTQIDRRRYQDLAKQVLENQDNLQIRQAEVVEILFADGKTVGIATRVGGIWLGQAVIIASGTYLNALIHVGGASYESGPDGNLPANHLADSLAKLGINLRRFKTGTPARVHGDSIDFSRLAVQKGDEPIQPFSFETTSPINNLVDCHMAYTNEKTHQVIRDNLHRSAMYGGQIEGVGPRYCPSIEDKVVRFAEKNRHQLFIEPVGLQTKEMYLQGMSSSLPEDVQLAFYRTIEGLEQVEIMRNAYAIEYDCCDPTDLLPTLNFIGFPGLYGAGQFNGSSGYEEAAAQGLIAGMNATRFIDGLEEIVLPRASSYIGTLIDDLVTKGCNDPYRMMTSRSEYRLLLRQDNADSRLTPLGYEIGLISPLRFARFEAKKAAILAEQERLAKVTMPASQILNDLLIQKETTPIENPTRFLELLKRPQLGYADLIGFDQSAPQHLSPEVVEQVEIHAKYEGYIKRQLAQVSHTEKLEKTRLPKDLDYSRIASMSMEAREKLAKIVPLSVGQAGRISGVSPADIQVLLVWLEQGRRREKEKDQ